MNQGSFIITNWGKCCYKLGQLLQIRTTVIKKQDSYYKLGLACATNSAVFLLKIPASIVTNQGSFIITNWGRCCYKLGQLLQIRGTVITKQGNYYKLGQKYYKLGQLLQIGAKNIDIQLFFAVQSGNYQFQLNSHLI